MSEWLEGMRELRRLIAEGRYGEVEMWVNIYEEAHIRDDEDYVELVEKDIPSELDRMLRESGLQCKIYYLKDDVNLPNYMAVCSYDGKKALVGLDVDIDWELGVVTEEGETVVSVRLLGAYVLNPNAKKEDIDSVLVYYTRR